MSEPHLLYQVENRVARFTINREAQRNAISLDAIALFLKYLDEAEIDENVRVILITGSGDKAFCSGADLGGAVDGKIQQGFKSYAELLTKLAAYPKPVVAGINGACMAGGMGLMLACDIVIAKTDAKFGTPEVNVGLSQKSRGNDFAGRKTRCRSGSGYRLDYPCRSIGQVGRSGRPGGTKTMRQKPHRNENRQAGVLCHGRYAF
jgi:enoyl-CoA hydratase/carnithine racemase